MAQHRHDGTTKQSICDERTKNFIFQGLNNQRSNVCFVQHNESLNEIYFCYLSGDDLKSVHQRHTLQQGSCVQLQKQTWAFYDLPNVSSGTTANVNSVATYATATAHLCSGWRELL